MDNIDIKEPPPKKDIKHPEPIGDVVLGTVNPAELTQEEFSNSQNLLFHGAGDHFVFNRDFDYGPDRSNAVSQTLGQGFYLTDDKNEASVYSEYRTKEDREEETTIVYNFLPFEAKMLDLRARDNPGFNAPVPIYFMEDWAVYFRQQMDKQFGENYDPSNDINFINSTPTDNQERQNKSLKIGVFGAYNGYINRLESNIKNKAAIDIRIMLALDGDPIYWLFTSSVFSEFMKSKGYDGLIAHEGGDVLEQKSRNPVSYVFYNLDKIGTFESWHHPVPRIDS